VFWFGLTGDLPVSGDWKEIVRPSFISPLSHSSTVNGQVEQVDIALWEENPEAALRNKLDLLLRWKEDQREIQILRDAEGQLKGRLEAVQQMNDSLSDPQLQYQMLRMQNDVRQIEGTPKAQSRLRQMQVDMNYKVQ
jgi:hypothetical protein